MARYVGKCVESILANDFTDYEIICINDASTDATLSVLKKLAETDSRIRIIDLKQNGGLANGRRVGISEAKGKYVSFIDPDDWVDRDYLSMLHGAMMSASDVDMVVMSTFFKEFRFLPSVSSGMVDKKFARLYGKPACFSLESGLMDTFFGRTQWSTSACGKLYRSGVVRDLPEIRVFYQEDVLLNLYATPRIKRICFTDSCQYHYRTGGGSSYNPNMIRDFIEVIRLKTEWGSANVPDFDRKHLPWLCVELKNCIYSCLERLVLNGGKEKDVAVVLEEHITRTQLDFIAQTKENWVSVYEQEDVQALLSGDVGRIYACVLERIGWFGFVKYRIKKMLSY